LTLRESVGNMYDFTTHQWNPVKGRCKNDCSYCYVKRFPVKDLRLDEKELKTFHGAGRFIFVVSGSDLFNDDVPKEWIDKVLAECRKYPENRYLFQSKNPKRFLEFIGYFPQNSILGTTIESNRYYPDISKAPAPVERALAMMNINLPRMITCEPILDFDLTELSKWIIDIKPEWINIGANSNWRQKLPEPDREQVKDLIRMLRENNIVVKLKDNLGRIYKE
jgi:protein gp37